MTNECARDSYHISTDNRLLDVDAIHAFLQTSYWAVDIPRGVVARAIENSFCFGLYQGESQVGFARVITDYTTFAYLADVFVLEAHRKKGLSKWLVEVIMREPRLQGLRRFMLATRDAHGLYERFGFTALAKPEMFMEIARPTLYQNAKAEVSRND